MAQFNIAEAKARFSELIQKAMLGEEVIVAKENKSVVRIVPIKQAKRKPGTVKGIRMEAGSPSGRSIGRAGRNVPGVYLPKDHTGSEACAT